ncbi:hypothetical protein JCM12298_08830 [Desulfothermus naphthae]
MTASILVGHFLGQGDFKEAKEVSRKIWMLGLTSITFMSIILWFFIHPVSAILSDDIGVQIEVVNYLKYNIMAIPFTVTTMIFGGTFIGAGATKLNMICVGGSVWIIRVPLAYLLGHIILKEPTGIWISMFFSQVVQAIFMTGLFFKNQQFSVSLWS